MAEPESIVEGLDIELNKLTPEDKLNLIYEICGVLTAQQLRAVRIVADKLRLEKLEEAKEQVIAKMRQEFAELDLDFDEVMGFKRARAKRPPKYRSPDGRTWSGVGIKPKWAKEYEEAGGDIEDYLIKDEE